MSAPALNGANKTQTCPRCGVTKPTLGAFASHVRFDGCGVTEPELFYAKVDRRGPNGCWIWLGFLNHDGYGRVGPKRGVRRGGRAHKIAWEMVHGPVPAGMEVMHKCDTRACVRPDHLQLGTHRQNMDDCYAKLRHAHGIRNIHAKLTEDQVREIRKLYKKTGPRSGNGREVAAMFNVTVGVVHCIGRGDTWKHLK